VASIVAFAMYAYTAAPDIPLVDSGELALAAATGGVAHPPGVPLYLLAGRAFGALGPSPVRALNLMSAFFAALAVGAVWVAADRCLAILPRPSRDAVRDESFARTLAAVAATVAFATAYNPWTWSAVTEVYSLNVFLLAASWGCALRAVRSSGDGIPWKAWIAAIVFAALGLANHHATAIVWAPGLLLLAAVATPRPLSSPRFAIAGAVAVLGSVALYAYLFAAARHDPGLSWGGIESWSLLVRHVTGQQYSQQVGAPPGESVRVLREFASTLLTGSGWLASALAFAGVAFAFRRGVSARLRLLAGGVPLVVIAVDLALAVQYVAGPEDRMAYDLPAAVAWCLCVSVGAWALFRRLPNAAIVAVVLAIGAENAWRNAPLCDLREERTARLFVEEMLRDVPQRSVILTAEWNFYAPYLYLRHVEDFRPDLRVIDVLMMRRFWYVAYVERTMSEFVERSRAEFDVFRDEVTRFDLGQPYDAVKIQSAYDALMRRWVAIGQEDGRAFVDWACLEQPQELSWIGGLPLAPDALMLRVDEPDDPAPGPIRDMDAANLRYVRGKLTDATLAGDASDLRPRHDPYRKVWLRYQAAVDASLSDALRAGGEAALAERARKYAAWYPEIERAQRVARERLGSRSAP